MAGNKLPKNKSGSFVQTQVLKFMVFALRLLFLYYYVEKKHFTVRSEVDILMCLFVLTSKCCSICPFSPGIEEHAGNDEMPSFEGSTVLFVLPRVA